MTQMRILMSVAAGLLIFLVLIALKDSNPKDSTDPPDGRSGMRLMIDYRTGCHYLGNGSSGIMPRLDQSGKHVCYDNVSR